MIGAPPMARARGASLPAGVAGAVRDVFVVTRRNLVHIVREPMQLSDVTIQPVLFTLLRGVQGPKTTGESVLVMSAGVVRGCGPVGGSSAASCQAAGAARQSYGAWVEPGGVQSVPACTSTTPASRRASEAIKSASLFLPTLPSMLTTPPLTCISRLMSRSQSTSLTIASTSLLVAASSRIYAFRRSIRLTIPTTR